MIEHRQYFHRLSATSRANTGESVGSSQDPGVVYTETAPEEVEEKVDALRSPLEGTVELGYRQFAQSRRRKPDWLRRSSHIATAARVCIV